MVIGMFCHRRKLRSDKLTAFYVIFVLTSGLKSTDSWRPSQHSHRSQKSNYYHQLIENLEKFEKAKFDDGTDDEGQLGTSGRHDGPVNEGRLGASWRHDDGAEMMNKRSSNKTSGQREESGNEKKEHLRYSVALDSRGDILLFWDIDTSREIIHFRLRAKVDKSDLLAFGFSDYGETTKADFVVMWTDYNGIHMFQDTHTDSRGLLHVDPIQNYDLDRVYVAEDDFIVTEFHRVYDTCDNDDYLIDSGTTHMIYFVKKGPQQSITRWNVSAEKIGMQRVQLIKSQLPVVPLPADTETLTMHVDNVPIPEDETTYWCAVRKLPDFKEKRHIVRFEGAISEQGKGIVHHLEVFHCQIPAEVTINHYDAPCSSKSERPPGLQTCTKVLGAWAMGAQSVSYPEEAGSPIGGKNFSRYVMLEVHYNNPDHAKGLIDSSGIKFYLTKKLRKYDAGIMEIGLEYTDKMALPPGLPIWKLNGYCIPECTQVGLPEGGIKVFSSQLHTHLTGKQIFTKHYRNGIELPELNRDSHYSPHYQEVRRLPRLVHVLPGDALVTTCVDQTADRREITLGGFSISDEMCVNYVHYYPLAELEVCKSSVTTDSLMRFFKFLHDYQGEDTMRTEAISENYKSINWTPINVNLLKTYYEMSPLSMQCNQSDGNRFPGHWENTHIPVIEAPMPPTVRPCLQ